MPTPGQYIRECRLSAGLTLEEVALRFATEPKWPKHVRVDWLRLVEQDQTPVTFDTLALLQRVVPFSFERLAALKRGHSADYAIPDVSPAQADHADQAAGIRCMPLSAFASPAEDIVNSSSVAGVYAACEWDELGENGQQWIAAIVRETVARGTAPAAVPTPSVSA